MAEAEHGDPDHRPERRLMYVVMLRFGSYSGMYSPDGSGNTDMDPMPCFATYEEAKRWIKTKQRFWNMSARPVVLSVDQEMASDINVRDQLARAVSALS